jgi:nucleotide-binding universal stress UspA family protein
MEATMKNVLVLIHDDTGQEARLQAALDFTRALGGHLTCLDVAIIPLMIEDYVPIGGSALLLADELASERTNRARIEGRLANEDVPWDWIDATDGLNAAMCKGAALADVIVINTGLDDAYPDMRRLAGELLVSAETPVLAVPEEARSFDAAGRALIAWDGSKPAQEALQAAIPLLKLAENVTLLEVNDDSLELPASEAAKYLSRHGIEPVIRTIPTAFERASDVILAEARDQRAAYLVMGGYGHGRMLEAVIGGVTKRMLTESPVPLFLAH